MAPGKLLWYDDYGRLTREGLDVDADGSLSVSLDLSVKDFELSYQVGAPGDAAGIYKYEAVVVYPYTGANSAVSRWASQQYTQVGGFGAGVLAHTIALDFDRNKSEAFVAVDRSASKRTVSTTLSGSSQTAEQVFLSGQIVKSVNHQGHATLYTYDALGRVDAGDDPRVGSTSNIYYPNTVLAESTTSPERSVTFTYTDGGRVKSQTDQATNVTYFNYDDAGRVTHQWGTADLPVKFVYNDLGQKTELHLYRSGNFTGADLPSGFSTAGDKTSWNYQAPTGLLLSKADPEISGVAATVSYQYNALGRLSKRTDARNRETNYRYDGHGNVEAIDYTDAVTTDVSYKYDKAGRLETVTDSTGSRTFEYYQTWTDGTYEAELRNKSSRLQNERLPAFFGSHVITQGYQYGIDGRLNGALLTTQLNTGTSYKVTYAYDALLRPESVTYNTLTPFSYSYVVNSNLIDKVMQDAAGTVSYQRDYNYKTTSDRYDSIVHSWAAVTASRVEARLGYDLLGQRQTEKSSGTGYMVALGRSAEFGMHADYTYTGRREVDSSGKYLLDTSWNVGAFRTGTDRDYGYDGAGNRLSEVVGGTIGSYAPNARNQYGATPGVASLGYDANGNLTSDGTRTFDYDSENRLIKVTQGASVWNYKYDYLGRRVSKSGTGISEKRFIYNGWNLIAETDASGTIQRRFAWGLDVSGSLQGAGGVGGLLVIDTGSSTYFPVYDASHNVAGLYTSAGAFAAAYEYDPFGRQQSATGAYANENPFRYSTKYTDSETGFLYYGMRYYNTYLGRFISKDPIGEAGGLNLYSFCGNDGVNRYDYLGMDDVFQHLYRGDTPITGLNGGIGGWSGNPFATVNWFMSPDAAKESASGMFSFLPASTSSLKGREVIGGGYDRETGQSKLWVRDVAGNRDWVDGSWMYVPPISSNRMFYTDFVDVSATRSGFAFAPNSVLNDTSSQTVDGKTPNKNGPFAVLFLGAGTRPGGITGGVTQWQVPKGANGAILARYRLSLTMSSGQKAQPYSFTEARPVANGAVYKYNDLKTVAGVDTMEIRYSSNTQGVATFQNYSEAVFVSGFTIDPGLWSDPAASMGGAGMYTRTGWLADQDKYFVDPQTREVNVTNNGSGFDLTSFYVNGVKVK